ncbi:MAG TPA: adenylate/guanylate cyclase domain-containing protein [Burkholderiales bacterium]|nr:adenylate/guanylate cyclase domain-containing protein [Burkholderiales bacterium]
MMPERANRTFICSVLFLDIAEYSKKPVSEQIQLKDRFNALIADSIRDIAPNDRIILDTGDGVAVNFLGDPEDALFVAMSLRESFAPKSGEPPKLPARIGINLGPVRLVRDLNSQPNIIGDGINVAQRVMGFAHPGQILVSRSYYEVVLHISEGYTKLFNYEGSRTDKHVREHEVYSVGYTNSRASGIRSPAERAQASTHEGKRQASAATLASGPRAWASLLARVEPWLNNRTIAFGTATLSVGAFALAVTVNLLGHSEVAALSSQSGEIAAPKKAQAIIRQDDGMPSAPRKHVERKPRTAIARADSRQVETSLPAPKADAGDKKEAKRSPFSFFSREKPATEPASAAPAGSAIVTLAISPWGEVYVDGDRIGVSPPVNEVEVAPGKRKIEIRNGSFPVYTQVVDVKADQKVRIKHKFH